MSALIPNDEHVPTEGMLVHPDSEQIELAAVLHALSDPVRLQIVAAVADGAELTCGGLDLPVSKSTCTHHLRVLREAGVIRQRIVGTMKLNSLRREELEHRFPGLIDAVIAGAAPDAGLAAAAGGATAAGGAAAAAERAAAAGRASPTHAPGAAQSPAGASR